jgi:alkylhydroperoxidase/carboxymuconolactone decarboxylase family protein YurZ
MRDASPATLKAVYDFSAYALPRLTQFPNVTLHEQYQRGGQARARLRHLVVTAALAALGTENELFASPMKR